LNVTFTWEDQHLVPAVECTMEFDELKEAVDFGVSHFALFFTIEEENAERHYTNASEIKSAAQIIDYLQMAEARLREETLSRMFSRVSQRPQDQKEFSRVRSVKEAISLLQQESPDARFITPSNGGYIKLEQGDKAYNRFSQQIWPPKIPPQNRNTFNF
jgi:hypothetical protein